MEDEKLSTNDARMKNEASESRSLANEVIN